MNRLQRSKLRLSKKRPKNLVTFKVSFTIGLSTLIIILMICFLRYDLPSISALSTPNRKLSITFEDYNGSTIAVYNNIFGEEVELKSLPQYVSNAIIAVEDQRFYQHKGFDFRSFIRSIFHNVVYRKQISRNSTITRQLAKNMFLTSDNSVRRRIQEILVTFLIENRFSKEQILTFYLNKSYFGIGAFGIESAAHKYFGKKAQELNIYESAKLAASIKKPRIDYILSDHENSDKKVAIALKAMLELGFISKVDLEEYTSENTIYNKESNHTAYNTYFINWVIEQLPDLRNYQEDLIVRTTLDENLQKNAIAIIRKALIDDGLKNSVNQAALLSMDSTGAVRIMIGGHTYYHTQPNLCLNRKNICSPFKLFIFLSAIEKELYQNDHSSLQNLFEYPLDKIPVVLVHEVGLSNISSMAKKIEFKLNSIDKDSNQGSLLELAVLYNIIMTNGTRVIPYGIIHIRTKSGKTLYNSKVEKTQILNQKICENMKSIMQEYKLNNLSIPTYCHQETSNGTDACFIGFASPLVSAVWVGNDNRVPISQKITGGTLPAKIWKEFMQAAFSNTSPTKEIQQPIPKQIPPKKVKIKDFIDSLS